MEPSHLFWVTLTIALLLGAKQFGRNWAARKKDSNHQQKAGGDMRPAL